MRPSSHPALSTRARALLAAERVIVPAPAELRRRALLRSRTASWQVRDRRTSHARFLSTWKRLRVLVVAAFAATSAFAAWQQLAPEPVDVPPTTALGVVPPPTAAKAPRAAQPLVKATAAADLATAALPSAANRAPPAPKDRAPARSRSEAPRRQAAPSEELTLLDHARRAVMARNFERALRTIERHARSFPNSPLGEEREALRVRALQGAGRSTQANHAAREFESRYPSSVLAPELNKGD